LSFGKRLRKLREEKELSQLELAKNLDIANSTLSLYESGKREPDFATLQKIASFFKCSADYLLSRTDNPDPLLDTPTLPPNAYPVGEMVKIPVLGVIRCGEPIYAEQNIIGWENVPAEEVKGGEYFYLEVTGDSMTGSRIYPGDRVLVRRQPEIENGEIAVVLIEGEEATLKRVKYLEDMIMLYPDNPKYEPQIYKPEEVQILGKVVEVKFKP